MSSWVLLSNIGLPTCGPTSRRTCAALRRRAFKNAANRRIGRQVARALDAVLRWRGARERCGKFAICGCSWPRWRSQNVNMPCLWLTQHQLRIGHAHGLRRHNLVSQRIFEHTVLMDSGLVGEGIASSDSFIRLHGHAGNLAEHLAGGEELLAGDAELVRIEIATYGHGHDNLFQRGVATAFASTINRS